MGTIKNQPQFIKMEDLVVGKTYRNGGLPEMLMTYLGSKEGFEDVAFFKIPNNVAGFLHNENDEEDVYGIWNGGNGFNVVDDEDEPQPTRDLEVGKRYMTTNNHVLGTFVGYDEVGDPLFKPNPEDDFFRTNKEGLVEILMDYFIEVKENN